MGIDRNNFYGPYMRIWLPDQEYSYSMKTCPSVDCIKHKTYISEKYCSKCGCEVIELKYSETHQVNLHEFLEEELGYGDLFIEVEPHNTDYILAVPNFISKQGGWHFEDCDQTEILTLSRDSVQDIN